MTLHRADTQLFMLQHHLQEALLSEFRSKFPAFSFEDAPAPFTFLSSQHSNNMQRVRRN